MELENPNPFVEYNKAKKDAAIVVPTFPRHKNIKVVISEEAWERLQHLIATYTIQPINNIGLSALIEQIGLYALDIERPQNIVDPESLITTEDCRQSGYLDAIHGDLKIFVSMYGKNLTNKHQAAYMRGYFEGNYIKSKGK